MTAKIENPLARQLIEQAIELDRLSSCRARPEIDDETRELLIDCGEPGPGLLAVFERNDQVEGCFDEDCQTMLEVTPSPNLIIPFSGETNEGVLGAFTILATACETLSFAGNSLTPIAGAWMNCLRRPALVTSPPASSMN